MRDDDRRLFGVGNRLSCPSNGANVRFASTRRRLLRFYGTEYSICNKNLMKMKIKKCLTCMFFFVQMIENEDFKSLVVEDAKALNTREEADTIDVIDNIRFHLTATSIDDAQDKLEMIDSLLDSLNLEG